MVCRMKIPCIGQIFFSAEVCVNHGLSSGRSFSPLDDYSNVIVPEAGTRHKPILALRFYRGELARLLSSG